MPTPKKLSEEMKRRFDLLEIDVARLRKDLTDECKTSMQAQWALAQLGLPSVGDPDFKRAVLGTAVLLGLYERKREPASTEGAGS